MPIEDLPVIKKEGLEKESIKPNFPLVDYPVKVEDNPTVYKIGEKLFAHAISADCIINLDEYQIK